MADGGKVIIKIDGDNKEFQKDVQSTKKMVNTIATSATKAFSKVAKTAAIGFSAVGASIGFIGKSAISAYADYEQLVGGVETLFKENASAVIENANNAFRTAGMSANQYMDTVTSFSASLLQSLDGDTALAVQKADMAITDMSDNANKMGTNIGMIQDAYQGFAKQNFTMLDNLKLGYGGTKTEMERLLADAEAIKAKQGEVADYSIDSYADIVDAIHVVQTEMGITGTTAEEASSTIQGSLNTAKAAWKNLMAALTDPKQNLSDRIEKFSESVETFVKNLVPRIKYVVFGVTKLITVMVPDTLKKIYDEMKETVPFISEQLSYLADQIGEMFLSGIKKMTDSAPVVFSSVSEMIGKIATKISESAPLFIGSITGLLNEVLKGTGKIISDNLKKLPELSQSISNAIYDNFPAVMQTVFSVIGDLIDGSIEYGKSIVDRLPEVIQKIVDFIAQSSYVFTDAFAELFNALGEKLPEMINLLIDQIPVIVDAITDALLGQDPKMAESGKKLFIAIIKNLPDIIFAIVSIVPKIVVEIVKAFLSQIPKIVEAGFNLLKGIATGIVKATPEAIKETQNFIKTVVCFVKENINISTLIESGLDFIKGFINGISSAIGNAISKISSFCSNSISTFSSYLNENTLFSVGYNLLQGLLNGINSMIDKVLGVVNNFIGSIKNAFTGIKGFFIRSPSRWAYKVGAYIVEGFGNGIEENSNYAIHAVESLTEDVKTEVEKAAEEIAKASEDITQNMTEEEKKLFEALQKDIENNKKAIQDTFKEITASAFDSIEELEKAQKNLEDKLKGYGTLVANIKIKNEVSGEEKTIVTLGDLKAQTAALEKYEDTLLRVKERGNVPAEFFEVIRDMDMDEAMTFADLLLSASDEEFDEFIKDWTTQQETAARIAKELYRDESKELAASISEQFEKTPEEFFELGEESIKQFGDGFMDSLKNVMDTVRDGLRISLAEIMPSGEIQVSGSPAAASAGGGDTYIINSPGSTIGESIRALKNQAAINRLRGY